MPSPFTKKERTEVRQIKNRIAIATKALEEALVNENVRGIAEARREISAANKQMAVIRKNAAARKETQSKAEADALLAEIREQFPVIGVSSGTDWGKLLNGESQPEVSHEPQHVFTVEELTQEIQATCDRLQSLGSDTKYFAVRKYLEDRINGIGTLLRAANGEKQEQARLAKQAQAKKDAIAADKATREWREKFQKTLASGFLPLVDREAIRKNAVVVAAQYRAKQHEAGNAIDEDGVHIAAVLAAKAEFWEHAAKILEIYDCDLEHPDPINEADDELFASRFAFSPAYFNFRTRDEKSKLVWRAKRYFQAKNNMVGLSQLPYGVPDPVLIEKKPYVSLEQIEFRNTEDLFNALKPLDDGQSLEVIFRCPTATLDSPHSQPEYYWPSGELVDMRRDVVWDKKIQKFRRPPEPEGLSPKWGGPQRFSWEQDLEGNWVRVAVNDGGELEQDLTGSFVSKPTGQLKPGPVVEIRGGPHRPPKDDDRQFFRSGHWWTAEDIEQANRVSFNLKMLPSGAPQVSDQIVWPRNETAPTSDEEKQNCWRKHENKIKSELKEREEQYV